MINDTIFAANMTTYRNYLQQANIKYKEPSTTLHESKLLRLFLLHYGYNGNFIYGIEVQP